MLLNFDPRAIIVFCVVTLAVYVNVTVPIRCYQCNSFTSDYCVNLRNRYAGNFLAECESNFTVCRKHIRQTLQTNVERVIRQCVREPYLTDPSILNANRSYCHFRGRPFLNENVCDCFQDGCNFGLKTLSDSFLFVATLICGFSITFFFVLFPY